MTLLISKHKSGQMDPAGRTKYCRRCQGDLIFPRMTTGVVLNRYRDLDINFEPVLCWRVLYLCPSSYRHIEIQHRAYHTMCYEFHPVVLHLRMISINPPIFGFSARALRSGNAAIFFLVSHLISTHLHHVSIANRDFAETDE